MTIPKTPPLRPFYNTVQPEFTVRSLTSTNPIGAMQTYGVDRASVVIDVADFGAESNLQNITKAKAIENRQAIQRAIDELPDSGGTLLIAGLLQYYGTIRAPERVFTPQQDYRPIPLAIQGVSPDATLANLAASPAIQRTDGYSFQVPSTVAPFTLCGLQIFSAGKGIVIRGGGKNVRLSRLVIFGCTEAGLEIDGFDGGIIHDVDARNNRGDGIRISNAHQCSVHVKAFGNLGSGLVLRSSNSWQLWADLEANTMYGLDAEDCKLINATIWEEANNTSSGSRYKQQGRLRRSQLHFNGIAQQEAGLAFDWDTYSRIACTFAGQLGPSTPLEKLAPYKLDLPFPFQHTRIARAQDGLIAIDAKSTAGMVFTCAAGAFSQQPIDTTTNWIEPYSADWYPETAARTIDVGDAVIVRASFKLSPESATYFKGLMAGQGSTPSVKLNLSHDAVSESCQYWITDGDEFVIELTGFSTKKATSQLRCFFYICPEKFGTLEPPAALSITLTEMSVYHVPAK